MERGIMNQSVILILVFVAVICFSIAIIAKRRKK